MSPPPRLPTPSFWTRFHRVQNLRICLRLGTLPHPFFPLQKNCQAPSPCAKLQPTQTKPLPPQTIFQRIADELWSNTYNLNRTQNQSFPNGTRMHESAYPLRRRTRIDGPLLPPGLIRPNRIQHESREYLDSNLSALYGIS